MIDIKLAVKNAKEFAHDFIEDTHLKNLKVDEIELDENEKYWLITLGWDDIIQPRTAVEAAMGLSEYVERDYRVFYVDTVSGVVKKMKLRE
jgi:predicted esterase YcpF (UPF0227 family)